MRQYGIVLVVLMAILFMFCETTISPKDEIDDSDTTAPAIPTGLAIDVNASIEDTIEIKWDVNTDNDFDYYRLYRSVGVDSLPLYQQILETRLTSYIDAGVNYGTLYFYRVSAVDESNNESEKSDAVFYEPVNIFAPAVPTGLTAYGYNLPGESPYIELRWVPNTESDFLHYNVFRHTSRAFTSDSAYFIKQTTETRYTDNDVGIGQMYYYRLTAVDKGLMPSGPTSDKSDQALPQPALVEPANGSTISITQTTFEWQRLDGAEKYKLIIQGSLIGDEKYSIEIAQPESGSTVSKSIIPSGIGLNSGIKYYWLVAVYSSGNTAANTYSAETWNFFTPAK